MPRFTKKTRNEYIQGKLGQYSKLGTPDLQYQCWMANIYPTKDSLERIREMQGEGLKNVLKKEEDGYFTRFRCPTFRTRKDGTVWTFTPPKIEDINGRPIDGDIVGAGSDVTLKLEVYEHPTPSGGRAIAARLVGVRVDNLVEFNPDIDLDDEGKEQVKGLREAPPLF